MRDNILAKIRLHTVKNPVHSATIEKEFKITGAEVRDIIRDLRRDSEPIASGDKGYYYAQKWEEIEPTIKDLEGRADSLYKTSGKIRERFFGKGSMFS